MALSDDYNLKDYDKLLGLNTMAQNVINNYQTNVANVVDLLGATMTTTTGGSDSNSSTTTYRDLASTSITAVTTDIILVLGLVNWSSDTADKGINARAVIGSNNGTAWEARSPAASTGGLIEQMGLFHYATGLTGSQTCKMEYKADGTASPTCHIDHSEIWVLQITKKT
jgi:hypothetical protein